VAALRELKYIALVMTVLCAVITAEAAERLVYYRHIYMGETGLIIFLPVYALLEFAAYCRRDAR
jgi:hypothetical protein